MWVCARGVGRLALGGEGVLDVREPQVRAGGLRCVERHLVFVGELEGDRVAVGVDVGDVCGGAVA
jgi:hypothetical protein